MTQKHLQKLLDESVPYNNFRLYLKSQLEEKKNYVEPPK
jgi:hypothetical protein